MSPKRAALRLLKQLADDPPFDDAADRLLLEAWLWRQAGYHGTELACRRRRAELIASRQRCLLAARGRFQVGL